MRDRETLRELSRVELGIDTLNVRAWKSRRANDQWFVGFDADVGEFRINWERVSLVTNQLNSSQGRTG